MAEIAKPKQQANATEAKHDANEGNSVFSGLVNPGLLSTLISTVDSVEISRAGNMRALNSTFESITKDDRLKDLVDFCKKTGHSIPLCYDWYQSKELKTLAITEDGIKICNRLVDRQGNYKDGDEINFQQSNHQGRFAMALALKNAAFASHPTTVKTVFEEAVEAVKRGVLPSQSVEPFRYAGV